MTVSGSTIFKVNISDDVIKSLEDLLEKKADVPDKIKQCIDDRAASFDDIKIIHDFLKDDGVMLHEILGRSEIVLPEPVVEPRNPELEARVQKLKRMVEQQQYNQMTRNVRAKARDPEESISAQLKFMDKQLIAVAQFVFSVGSGFAFGFYGVELIVGDLDFGFRLLLGVICSLIIALAEIYFLAKIIAELDNEGSIKSDEPSPNHSPGEELHFVDDPPEEKPAGKEHTD